MTNRKREDETTVYQQFISLMMRTKRQMFPICEARKLTPVQGMMVICMKPQGSKTMNELSCMMGCDASNITGLVDRLEANSLIERTADTRDKRVKKIRLSGKGVECRAAILDELRKTEVLGFKGLSSEEYGELRRILLRLAPVT
jgi:DNA-binding MarR family transcriptional regulator